MTIGSGDTRVYTLGNRRRDPQYFSRYVLARGGDWRDLPELVVRYHGTSAFVCAWLARPGSFERRVISRLIASPSSFCTPPGHSLSLSLDVWYKYARLLLAV